MHEFNISHQPLNMIILTTSNSTDARKEKLPAFAVSNQIHLSPPASPRLLLVLNPGSLRFSSFPSLSLSSSFFFCFGFFFLD